MADDWLGLEGDVVEDDWLGLDTPELPWYSEVASSQDAAMPIDAGIGADAPVDPTNPSAAWTPPQNVAQDAGPPIDRSLKTLLSQLASPFSADVPPPPGEMPAQEYTDVIHPGGPTKDFQPTGLGNSGYMGNKEALIHKAVEYGGDIGDLRDILDGDTEGLDILDKLVSSGLPPTPDDLGGPGPIDPSSPPDPTAPPLAEPAAGSDVSASDYLATIGAGMGDLAGALGWGLSKLTPDGLQRLQLDLMGSMDTPTVLRAYGKWLTSNYESQLSEDAKAVSKKEWTSDKEGEFFGPAVEDPHAYGLAIARSAPGTAGGMGAGALFTHFLRMMGMSTIPAGMVGFSAGEAMVAAPMSGQSTEDKALQVDEATIAKSEAYQQMIADGIPKDLAKISLAEAAGERAAMTTAGTTALLSGPFGALMGKFLKEGGPLLARSFKGGVTEAVQEFFQSGSEAISGNLATRSLINPDQSLTEGALESAVGGFASGGIMGTGMAAMSPAEGVDEADAKLKALQAMYERQRAEAVEAERQAALVAREEAAEQARQQTIANGGDALDAEVAAAQVMADQPMQPGPVELTAQEEIQIGERMAEDGFAEDDFLPNAGDPIEPTAFKPQEPPIDPAPFTPQEPAIEPTPFDPAGQPEAEEQEQAGWKPGTADARKRNIVGKDRDPNLPLDAYLAQMGGVTREERDIADAATIRSGILRVFTKNGMSYDDALEVMVEDGWLPEGSTIQDVEQLLDRVGRGEQIFNPNNEQASQYLVEKEYEEYIRAQESYEEYLAGRSEMDDVPFSEEAEYGEIADLMVRASNLGLTDEQIEEALDEFEDNPARGLSERIAEFELFGPEQTAGSVQGEEAPLQPVEDQEEGGSTDLFGAVPVRKQSIADAQAEVDARLSGGDVPADVDGGLFSNQKNQIDITDASEPRSTAIFDENGNWIEPEETEITRRDDSEPESASWIEQEREKQRLSQEEYQKQVQKNQKKVKNLADMAQVEYLWASIERTLSTQRSSYDDQFPSMRKAFLAGLMGRPIPDDVNMEDPANKAAYKWGIEDMQKLTADDAGPYDIQLVVTDSDGRSTLPEMDAATLERLRNWYPHSSSKKENIKVLEETGYFEWGGSFERKEIKGFSADWVADAAHGWKYQNLVEFDQDNINADQGRGATKKTPMAPEQKAEIERDWNPRFTILKKNNDKYRYDPFKSEAAARRHIKSENMSDSWVPVPYEGPEGTGWAIRTKATELELMVESKGYSYDKRHPPEGQEEAWDEEYMSLTRPARSDDELYEYAGPAVESLMNDGWGSMGDWTASKVRVIASDSTSYPIVQIVSDTGKVAYVKPTWSQIMAAVARDAAVEAQEDESAPGIEVTDEMIAAAIQQEIDTNAMTWTAEEIGPAIEAALRDQPFPEDAFSIEDVSEIEILYEVWLAERDEWLEQYDPKATKRREEEDKRYDEIADRERKAAEEKAARAEARAEKKAEDDELAAFLANEGLDGDFARSREEQILYRQWVARTEEDKRAREALEAERESQAQAEVDARYDGSPLGNARKKIDPWTRSGALPSKVQRHNLTDNMTKRKIGGVTFDGRLTQESIKNYWKGKLESVGVASSGTGDTLIARGNAVRDWVSAKVLGKKLPAERVTEMLGAVFKGKGRADAMRAPIEEQRAMLDKLMAGVASPLEIQMYRENRDITPQPQQTEEVPMEEIEITEEFETTDGEVVEVTQTAEEVIESMDAQLEALDNLLKCMD